MRITLIMLLFVGALSEFGRAAPKGVGQMMPEEIRDEVHRLSRDYLPYAPYIRRLTEAADQAWPTLDENEKNRYRVHIYGRLMDALRLLTDQTALPDDPSGRRYQAAISVSLAIDEMKRGTEYKQFYEDVFNSSEFKSTNSAFKDAVIDLWRRYERAGKTVPYTQLLILNQTTMGRPNGYDGDWIRSPIAEMYAELGDHDAEAKWYEGVSPAGLGALKVADALYAAGRYPEAAEKYRYVLDELDGWAKLKPKLKDTALAEPLQFVDLSAIKEKAQARADISERAATLSLVGQLSSMVLALLVGRFVLKSRLWIWIVAFAGAFGAMFTHMLMDGQGAFLLLIFAPVIYGIAVLRRRNLA